MELRCAKHLRQKSICRLALSALRLRSSLVLVTPLSARISERQIILLRRAEEPGGIRQCGQPPGIPSKAQRHPKWIVPQAESPRPRNGLARGPRGQAEAQRRPQAELAPWDFRVVI